MAKVGGVGRHVQYLERNDPTVLAICAKGTLAFEFLHATAVTIPKTFMMLFQIRLFQWKGPMLWISRSLLALIIVLWIITCSM